MKGDELFFRHCPYCHGGAHGDKDTFSVNLATGLFKCFRSGCNKHGHFVELARDFNYQLDFKGQTPARVYRKFPVKEIEVRDPAVEYLASRGSAAELRNDIRSPAGRITPLYWFFRFMTKKVSSVISSTATQNTRREKGARSGPRKMVGRYCLACLSVKMAGV